MIQIYSPGWPVLKVCLQMKRLSSRHYWNYIWKIVLVLYFSFISLSFSQKLEMKEVSR